MYFDKHVVLLFASYLATVILWMIQHMNNSYVACDVFPLPHSPPEFKLPVICETFLRKPVEQLCIVNSYVGNTLIFFFFFFLTSQWVIWKKLNVLSHPHIRGEWGNPPYYTKIFWQWNPSSVSIHWAALQPIGCSADQMKIYQWSHSGGVHH